MFEKCIRNERNDRYKLMYFIDAYDKQQSSYVNGGSSGGDNSLPSNSTTEAFVSIGATVDFIDFRIKCFDHNYLERSNMFIEIMKSLFLKTSV